MLNAHRTTGVSLSPMTFMTLTLDTRFPWLGPSVAICVAGVKGLLACNTGGLMEIELIIGVFDPPFLDTTFDDDECVECPIP